jgi:hypothetical protein
MMDNEQQIRNELIGPCMRITKKDSIMFDNIDSFVALSRDNTSVQAVAFNPFDSEPGNYEVWDKVGQIVGNFTELNLISLNFLPYPDDNDGDEARMPDWETLTRILPYLRRKVSLSLSRTGYDAEVEHIQGLARAIP